MQLLLNGKKMTCPCDHLEDLKAAYGSGQEITIVNGFATTENLALKEGDEIYFIPKDRLPPKEALEGMMCSRHTPKVHQKVSAGRVAICGLGGLALTPPSTWPGPASAICTSSTSIRSMPAT